MGAAFHAFDEHRGASLSMLLPRASAHGHQHKQELKQPIHRQTCKGSHHRSAPHQVPSFSLLGLHSLTQHKQQLSDWRHLEQATQMPCGPSFTHFAHTTGNGWQHPGQTTEMPPWPLLGARCAAAWQQFLPQWWHGQGGGLQRAKKQSVGGVLQVVLHLAL
eukprot:1139201-Pelagomonas_calceolata.AAC.3